MIRPTLNILDGTNILMENGPPAATLPTSRMRM